MRVRFWGVRGSIPVAAPSAARYGGNTSCVAVALSDGTSVVLDAGTGIRELGKTLAGSSAPVHVLLSHLHLDHIHGLLFFAPFFDPGREVVVWGPPSADGSLRDRLARYLSAPLAPIELRELPARVTFRTFSAGRWRLGSSEVEAALVNHRGTTLGFRISEGDTSLCYLPDHEPALGQSLEEADGEWVSGYGVARGASLLIHDAQYTDEEYPRHMGWGHSALSDALLFARRAEVERLALFHHDPVRNDEQLHDLGEEARARWTAAGGASDQIEVAAEGCELELSGT
jgi:phosphoribosyl 1,2-cyclic phosphodiesterase